MSKHFKAPPIILAIRTVSGRRHLTMVRLPNGDWAIDAVSPTNGRTNDGGIFSSRQITNISFLSDAFGWDVITSQQEWLRVFAGGLVKDRPRRIKITKSMQAVA